MSEVIRLSVALAAGGVAASIVGVGVVVGALAYLVLPESRRRPSKQVVVEQTAPQWAAQRLVSNLVRGRGTGEILFEGVQARAQWVPDERQGGGYFWLEVGEYSGPAADLAVVLDVTASRLSAIQRERARPSWSEPAFVRGGGVC